MTVSRLVFALSMATLVGALAGCAEDPVEHLDTPVSDPIAVERHHHDPSEAHAKASQECIAPVEKAYPCVGPDLPEGAKPIEAIGHVPYLEGEIATFMLPSEHIGCEVVHHRVTCLVSAWPHEIDPDRDARVPGAPSINLDAEGPIHMEAKADAPFWGGGIEGVPRGQVLPYGSVWYHNEFVFASEPNGLTFWNRHSGFGAFINADGYWTFPHQGEEEPQSEERHQSD